MARVAGVDIPNDKRTEISLRYIYGIGPFLAKQLCEKATIDPGKRARDLTEDELAKITGLLDNDYTVEGQLRRQVQQNIRHLQYGPRSGLVYWGGKHREQYDSGRRAIHVDDG